MRSRSSGDSPRAFVVPRWRLKVHRLLRLNLILFGCLLAVARAVAALPVREERLGAWHYLYPLEFFEGGDPKHSRNASAPTAVAFRGRS